MNEVKIVNGEGKKKIKVLVVISKLRIGGAEKVAVDIGVNADKSRFELDYLVFGDEKRDYEEFLLKNGCRVICFPEPSDNFGDYLKSLKKLIKENGYNVIHAHTMFNCGWAMLVGKLCGVKVRISHAHSALLEERGVKTKLYEFLMRMLISLFSTDIVACGKKAGERLYGKKAFEKRGKLILNGIDVKSFKFDGDKRQLMREKLSLSDSFVIGHAGHIYPVKNQAFLVDIMPEILNEKPNAKLLLLGDGPDREALEGKIKALGLTDKVLLTGNVTNVSDYLSAMDVFAFPSLYEGTPLSIIEVQSNGLPCVISDAVPEDVYLTDLVTPLSLEKKQKWIEKIISFQRSNPESYNEFMQKSEFELSVALNKFYGIYEGANK